MSEMDRAELLRDPRRWQACSVEPFVSLTPDKIFQADYSQQYIRIHDELWKRMQRLHTSLVILEQLHAFPFDLVYAPHQMDFWTVTFEGILDSGCVLLHSLLKEPKSDECSLKSLNTYVFKSPWLDSDLRAQFQNEVSKSNHKSAHLRDFEKRVADARDKHISHHIFSLAGPPKRPEVEISLQELFELFRWAHTYFGLHSFGCSYCTITTDSMPTSRGRDLSRTCLDEVLDGVLRNSHYVNHPELRGEWWDFDRQHMSEEKILKMNELRRRIGLPEA